MAAQDNNSKIPFADISFNMEYFNFSLDRQLVGSRQAKNDYDGTAAVVKSAVMTSQAVISSAKENAQLPLKLTIPDQVDGQCMHAWKQFFLVSQYHFHHHRPEITGEDRLLWRVLGNRGIPAVFWYYSCEELKPYLCNMLSIKET